MSEILLVEARDEFGFLSLSDVFAKSGLFVWVLESWFKATAFACCLSC